VGHERWGFAWGRGRNVQGPTWDMSGQLVEAGAVVRLSGKPRSARVEVMRAGSASAAVTRAARGCRRGAVDSRGCRRGALESRGRHARRSTRAGVMRAVNSRGRHARGQLARWSTRALVNSRVGQLARWSTRAAVNSRVGQRGAVNSRERHARRSTRTLVSEARSTARASCALVNSRVGQRGAVNSLGCHARGGPRVAGMGTECARQASHEPRFT
jgi:hypothetical protein